MRVAFNTDAADQRGYYDDNADGRGSGFNDPSGNDKIHVSPGKDEDEKASGRVIVPNRPFDKDREREAKRKRSLLA